MTHEEICTYEVAKLAKEKGFPQEIEIGGYWYATKYYKNSCLGEYFEEERTQAEDYHDKSTTYYFIDEGIAISAPTQSLLQRWLREEKGYYVYPFFDNKTQRWTWICRELTGDMWIQLLVLEERYFDTYEHALEDALKYALSNLV